MWLLVSPLITNPYLSYTPQELGNGNISSFNDDGDELNVQDCVLVDQVSTLTVIVFVCFEYCVLPSLLDSYL